MTYDIQGIFMTRVSYMGKGRVKAFGNRRRRFGRLQEQILFRFCKIIALTCYGYFIKEDISPVPEA